METTTPIITVKNIGKKYNINHEQGRYIALRDVLMNVIKNPFHFFKTKAKQAIGVDTREEFWALKDVNFTINRGEVVGIIGKNGAGKSTLLKILSQITPPTTGEIKINGRVGSLLEVGTGFHPELTGRENIFLNGAILGMRKKEIAAKFDQIVEFAGIEKFLDTPVKYYSSGMYVRLAFSVAAHMEPDILIIDEVLAVGDAEFQKKCLGKMDEITKKDGRTILFVSHNLSAIEQLCTSCVLLEHGKVSKISKDVKEIINSYVFGKDNESMKTSWTSSGETLKNPQWSPVKMYLTDKAGQLITTSISPQDEITLHLEGNIEETDNLLTIGYALYNTDNTPLFWSYPTDKNTSTIQLKRGHNHLKTSIPSNILAQGTYRIELIGGIHGKKWLFRPFDTNPNIYFAIQGLASESPLWNPNRPTLLSPVLTWKLDQ